MIKISASTIKEAARSANELFESAQPEVKLLLENPNFSVGLCLILHKEMIELKSQLQQLETDRNHSNPEDMRQQPQNDSTKKQLGDNQSNNSTVQQPSQETADQSPVALQSNSMQQNPSPQAITPEQGMQNGNLLQPQTTANRQQENGQSQFGKAQTRSQQAHLGESPQAYAGRLSSNPKQHPSSSQVETSNNENQQEELFI
jgi:hypothetical protein